MRVPISTLHLFPILDQKLIELLKSLTPEDWNKKTRAKQWTVKDIAGHLLDGNLRTLSISRDRHFGEAPENIQSYQDLVNFLNRLNADWVKAMKRLSPVVLIDLLETTGHAYYTHLASLNPMEEAIFSVGWAGEDKSLNWLTSRGSIPRSGIISSRFVKLLINPGLPRVHYTSLFWIHLCRRFHIIIAPLLRLKVPL